MLDEPRCTAKHAGQPRRYEHVSGVVGLILDREHLGELPRELGSVGPDSFEELDGSSVVFAGMVEA